MSYFGCQVLKVSQFNKTNERFLIVSETSIYKVDPRKHFSRIAYLKFCLDTFLLDLFLDEGATVI